jgi:AcrR family transcriptional regulator
MAAADRREVILAAARRVFAERGFHEASLDTVAERAGVSKALIYEHFESKVQLHGAVLEASRGELLGRVAAAVGEVDTPEDRLRVGLEAFLTFVEEDRDAWRMLFRSVSEPEIAASLHRVQEGAIHDVAELVARDAPAESPVEGASVDMAVEMIAQQLVGAGQALANWWDEHRDVSRDAILQAHMDFAWLGLERLARGERWQAD